MYRDPTCKLIYFLNTKYTYIHTIIYIHTYVRTYVNICNSIILGENEKNEVRKKQEEIR